MSDPNKDPTVKQSTQPQEVPKLEDFKGVLGWVQKKKDESKASGQSWGWLMAVLAAVVVFVALAYAAYTAWKKGREIAKLKHKIDVDEEKKIAAEAEARININDRARAKLKEEAAVLGNLIEEGKKQIKELEEERKALNDKIDKITSWEDVDNL